MEQKMIVAPSSPMAMHYEHLAYRATAPLARTRSALQISLQSSMPPSTTYTISSLSSPLSSPSSSSSSSSSATATAVASNVESSNVQESEKLIAKMCNEIQRRIPFKKTMVNYNKISHNAKITNDNDGSKSNHVCLASAIQTNCLPLQRSTNSSSIINSSFKERMKGNIRNDYDNEQFKYYSSQSRNSDTTGIFTCPEKCFKRRVTRQASFLAAVSAGNSHREIRSASTHDLRSSLNHSWHDAAGSTTHLTSYYANASRSNESSSTAMQSFFVHTSDSNKIKNYANLSQHSAYYIASENKFLNDNRCNNFIDQERQIIKKNLNIPQNSHSNTANMWRRQHSSNNENSALTKPTSTNLPGAVKVTENTDYIARKHLARATSVEAYGKYFFCLDTLVVLPCATNAIA
ncbi:unnamed protein product [Acanthocheilonema viteae]|uniref:Uncharacterized protein n=1 Tax=Acanthocheilonema viteae TaxID=6277 RepID=A0A498SRV0_ACAVI|nr:unnamed protein product [Acanthocheilonema viteae]